MGGNVDSSLFVKKSEKGIVYVALYVDDNLMIGNVEAINNSIAALKKNGLVLKIVEGLQEYLSCEVKFSTDKKKALIGELYVI